jgi:hypothetical protein
MSLDEVCEALSAKGLDMYVGVFQREVLDGARLADMDESALLALGLDRYKFVCVYVCVCVCVCVYLYESIDQ